MQVFGGKNVTGEFLNSLIFVFKRTTYLENQVSLKKEKSKSALNLNLWDNVSNS